MSDASGFGKLVPGFDFLQSLVKNAGSALPGIGQWVAPTLDPAELDKRIGELRTVQYWLEQNARMLAATIQALEVQRMTLSTLKSMNVQMGDLTESLKIKPQSAGPSAATSDGQAEARASAHAHANAPGEQEGNCREPAARRRRSDAVVGRAHEPVRRAGHQRDEGRRRRRREIARRRDDEAVDRCRDGDDEERRCGARPRRRRRCQGRGGKIERRVDGEEGGTAPALAARGRLIAEASQLVPVNAPLPEDLARAAVRSRPPPGRGRGRLVGGAAGACAAVATRGHRPLRVRRPDRLPRNSRSSSPCPRPSAQVADVLAACHRLEVPVVARGAGTGLSGGALPDPLGVTLSLAKFNRIVAIDRAARTATVQCGVRNLAISEAAAPHGLFYAPDPSSQIACSIGGNVAENSGGVHCLKYGLTLHNVLGCAASRPKASPSSSAAPRSTRPASTCSPPSSAAKACSR